jgi:alcohol dehydrogenase class IV
MDLKNMGAQKVVVVTDANVARLNVMKRVLAALDSEGIDPVVYDGTMVEPKDSSLDKPLSLQMSPNKKESEEENAAHPPAARKGLIGISFR